MTRAPAPPVTRVKRSRAFSDPCQLIPPGRVSLLGRFPVFFGVQQTLSLLLVALVAGLQGLRDESIANPAVKSWTSVTEDSLLPYLVQLLLLCTCVLPARILFLLLQREMISLII